MSQQLICRLDVGQSELPEAFEAEERSVPGLGDLLHLVSGRSLLGAVRERRAQNLGSSGQPDLHLGSAQHEGAHFGSTRQPGPHLDSSGHEGCAESLGSSGHEGHLGSTRQPVSRLAACMEGAPQLHEHRQGFNLAASPADPSRPVGTAEAMWSSSASHVRHEQASTLTHLEGERVRDAEHEGDGHSRPGSASLQDKRSDFDDGRGSNDRRKPAGDVLDLFIDDQLIATALRGSGGGTGMCPSVSDRTAGGRGSVPGGTATSKADKTAKAAEGTITIYRVADNGDHPLCTVDSSGRIVTAGKPREGVHHQMLTSATPFVRSLHFVLHTGEIPASFPIYQNKQFACKHKRPSDR